MSNNTVEKFEHNGYQVTISVDEYAESPDEWDDDQSILFVTTRNHYFQQTPDVCGYPHLEANDLNEAEVRREIKRDYHLLPLYMYAHSGVSLSLGNSSYPFNCPWDSGQVGFVLVKKRVGFRNIRKAAASHVEVWNQYLSGDVYEYLIETPDGELIDSCCGMYGFDYCRKEALAAVPSEPAPEQGDGDDIGTYPFEEVAV